MILATSNTATVAVFGCGLCRYISSDFNKIMSANTLYSILRFLVLATF